MLFKTYIGTLEPGAKDRIAEYYDQPFEIFDQYFELWIDQYPENWEKRLIRVGQMDWGSWLNICNREAIQELMAKGKGTIQRIVSVWDEREEPGRKPTTDLQNLPDSDWYGILNIEIW